MLIEKTIACIEALLKGMVFDCRSCGQCVLRQTGLICPMTCPKGLRNGPCGGTLDGHCEVFPDKPCVWVRIHQRVAGRTSLEPLPLLPSPDARLYNTSSYINLLNGSDRPTRQPLSYLNLGQNRTRQPLQTASQLERTLKLGRFVRTCEVRPPRRAALDSLLKQIQHIQGHFDAVNATAYLNARPSLPSPVTSAKLAELGLEAICQSTCRDHTKTSFIAELLQNQLNQVHNVLCLTGDSYKGQPRIKQVFDMDGALMLYEARHLRETGIVHFTGEKIPDAPRPWLGAAINPFTTPPEIPLRRLKQKALAGADFIQTQLVFDVPAFERFMAGVRQEGLDRDLFVIPGVPVVTSRTALDMLPKVPGVHLPPEIAARLAGAGPALEAQGVALARETAQRLSQIPGVAGVHLMLFGPSHEVLPEVIEALPRQRLDWPVNAAAESESNPPALPVRQSPRKQGEGSLEAQACGL